MEVVLAYSVSVSAYYWRYWGKQPEIFRRMSCPQDVELVQRIYERTRNCVAAEPSTKTPPATIFIPALKGTLSIRLPSQVLN